VTPHSCLRCDEAGKATVPLGAATFPFIHIQGSIDHRFAAVPLWKPLPDSGALGSPPTLIPDAWTAIRC
jgi:hypothetical protein